MGCPTFPSPYHLLICSDRRQQEASVPLVPYTGHYTGLEDGMSSEWPELFQELPRPTRRLAGKFGPMRP
ncbi:MAG: hypothetical protein HC884_00455 [Chloroflexaceae bacterium]|nr:hypothetical protein [Chloroflexaceae bacterium]